MRCKACDAPADVFLEDGDRYCNKCYEAILTTIHVTQMQQDGEVPHILLDTDEE